MVMVRCDADEHHFDSDKYSSCPYCRVTVVHVPEKQEEMQPVEAYKPPVTTIIGSKNKAQIPVVGWLIVIASPKDRDGLDNRGSDFRIIPGNNRIGRSTSMEICLDLGDSKIGRESHSVITYDMESNGFYILPGDARNLTHVYQEDKESDQGGKWDVVLTPRELEDLDRIKMGDTIMLFSPLCSKRFQWNFEEE